MPWWLKLKAAALYVALPPRRRATARAYAAICAECPTLRVYEEEGAVVIGGTRIMPYTAFCGPAPDDGSPEDSPHCRCLVLAQSRAGRGGQPITVKGRPMGPAGKTAKMATGCPQGRW